MMIKKVAMLCVALMLVTVIVAGCVSSSSSPSPTISALDQVGARPTTMQRQNPTAATPTPTTPTPQVSLSPRGLLPTQATVTPSGGASVAQGGAITFVTTLYSLSEHKNICGAVNYYIDDFAAGGTWNINPPGTCSASSGSLYLSGADTTKLSPGSHTLKIDWLGDSAYGPAQYAVQFVVASTPAPTPNPTAPPTPTPTPSPVPPSPFVGSINSNVYHYPSCYHVNAILPQNIISFPTAAAAQAAGYRPCEDCHPPT